MWIKTANHQSLHVDQVCRSSITTCGSSQQVISLLLVVHSQTAVINRMKSREQNALCHIYTNLLDLHISESFNTSKLNKHALPYTLFPRKTNMSQALSNLSALQIEPMTVVVLVFNNAVKATGFLLSSKITCWKDHRDHSFPWIVVQVPACHKGLKVIQSHLKYIHQHMVSDCLWPPHRFAGDPISS